MRMAPSITPADRLDRDMYLVLEDFRTGRFSDIMPQPSPAEPVRGAFLLLRPRSA
jgi:hypothetical protein